MRYLVSSLLSSLLLVSWLVGCGSAEPEATPTATPAPQVVPEPAPDLCGPFVARARHVASADSGCTSDEQCTCRSGLLFADCGGAASMDTAHRLSMIVREAAAEGCEPDGPRCAPRECAVACVEGRCVER